jgi:hypothetical protein
MEKDKLNQPVWFPEWGTVLQLEPLPAAQRMVSTALQPRIGA